MNKYVIMLLKAPLIGLFAISTGVGFYGYFFRKELGISLIAPIVLLIFLILYCIGEILGNKQEAQ